MEEDVWWEMTQGAGPPRASALLPDVLTARLEAAYVSVAADLPALRRTVEDSGVLWQRVPDPHLSVFTADRIVDRVLEAGRPPEDAVACLERASEIARGWSVHIERYTEIRLARRDDRRSLIALAAVRGLDPLFVRLSDVVGVTLAPPPAHVTLYTAPGGKGIGICDDRDLESLTTPASGALAATIMRALGGEM